MAPLLGGLIWALTLMGMGNQNEITASPNPAPHGADITISYKFTDAQTSVTLEITWVLANGKEKSEKVTITKPDPGDTGSVTVTPPVMAVAATIDDPDGDAVPEAVAILPPSA